MESTEDNKVISNKFFYVQELMENNWNLILDWCNNEIGNSITFISLIKLLI